MCGLAFGCARLDSCVGERSAGQGRSVLLKLAVDSRHEEDGVGYDAGNEESGSRVEVEVG